MAYKLPDLPVASNVWLEEADKLFRELLRNCSIEEERFKAFRDRSIASVGGLLTRPCVMGWLAPYIKEPDINVIEEVF